MITYYYKKIGDVYVPFCDSIVFPDKSFLIRNYTQVEEMNKLTDRFGKEVGIGIFETLHKDELEYV